MFRMVARLSRRRARTMPRQVALEQRDAGALDGDVGAGAHGDADIGGGQRRRIVDAVAGHRDDAARRRSRSTTVALLLRQHLGLDVVDAELARDRLGGRAVVAGQHDDADALRVRARCSASRRASP